MKTVIALHCRCNVFVGTALCTAENVTCMKYGRMQKPYLQISELQFFAQKVDFQFFANWAGAYDHCAPTHVSRL